MAAITLSINDARRTVEVEAWETLLDVLRERLGLTGLKKGCDLGSCGACTVLADGRRIKACLGLAAAYEGREITTIEGLGTPEAPHPLQTLFVKHDALQCGYCTPGQILSALGALDEGANSREALKEALSGNLCRCGAYPKIIEAVAEYAGL